MHRSELAEKHPWTQPWWKADAESLDVLIYFFLIHALAIIGVILFPLPGWNVFLATLIATACGGLGTTIGYHRGLAHRSVKLNPVIEQILIFFAVFNGSGAPSTWIANHRHHHAHSDTIDDVSSPRHGGFWWAHLRWLYQWKPSNMTNGVPT
jgi:stearoyl-CoA desaturase (delta-9 desaturase)